jgi:hypothetical protein
MQNNKHNILSNKTQSKQNTKYNTNTKISKTNQTLRTARSFDATCMYVSMYVCHGSRVNKQCMYVCMYVCMSWLKSEKI